MERGNIKFSILVPVYNSEEFLNACIESVLQQTYNNFELILVNDGSSDNSGVICDYYAGEYDNIVAYHKENAGQLHTREYAISKATGDYYVFLDSDDTLRQNALEAIAKKIAVYDCDCVIYQWERVFEGNVLSLAPKFPDLCITNKRELYRKCFLSQEYNSMCRKAVKAHVFNKPVDYFKDYSVRYGEDLVQTLTVLKNSEKVVFVDDVLYNYTLNPKSISQGRNYNTSNVDFRSYLSVLDFLEEESVWEEADYSQFRNYCIYLLCGRLLDICKQKMPWSAKKGLIKYLRSSEYYCKFLSKATEDELDLGKRAGIFKLFLRGHDTVLIAYLWSYWKIQDIKKLLKR